MSKSSTRQMFLEELYDAAYNDSRCIDEMTNDPDRQKELLVL